MERTTYRLERATQHDYDFLYRLLKTTMEHYYIETYGSWDDAVEQQYFQESVREWTYHIIIHNEQKTGCLSFKHDRNEIFLNEIQIIPQYQNKGIGTFVLQHLIELSQSSNRPITLEVLKVNIKAQKLYHQLNFVTCGETDTHYHMMRSCIKL